MKARNIGVFRAAENEVQNVDPVRPKLRPQPFTETEIERFRAGVDGHPGGSAIACARADEDDAAVPPAAHRRSEVVTQAHGIHDVSLDELLPAVDPAIEKF